MVETASGNAHFESSLVSTENIDVFTLKGPQNCAQNSAHHPSLSAAMEQESKEKGADEDQRTKLGDRRKRDVRGGPHTYINCDPILSFLGACES